MDNHRPFHLDNIYSRYNVVVFDDESEIREGISYIPSDGSDVSSEGESSDEDDEAEVENDEEEVEEGKEESEEIVEKEDIKRAFEEDDEEFIGDDVEEEEGDVEEKDETDEAGGEEEEANSDAEGPPSIASDGVKSKEGGEAELDRTVIETGRGAEVAALDRTALYDEEEEGAEAEGAMVEASTPDTSSATRRVGQKAKRDGASASSGLEKTRYSPAVVGQEVLEEDVEEGEALNDTQLVALSSGEQEQDGEMDITRNMDTYDAEDEEEGEGQGGDDQNDTVEDLAAEDIDRDEEEEEFVGVRGRRQSKTQVTYFDRRKERRRRMRQYYRRSAWYAAPSSLMVTQLLQSALGGRLSPEMLWQAALGVTDQWLRGNVAVEHYKTYCGFLRIALGSAVRDSRERSRYVIAAPTTTATATAADGEEGGSVVVPGAEAGHVEMVDEYRFFMHRHWSLFEAMFHSTYCAAKLGLWQPQGAGRLQELLARVGLPLQQSKQAFAFMAPSLRSHFLQQMKDPLVQSMYRLQEPTPFFLSFLRYSSASFKTPLAATDLVHAATALTELYGFEELASRGEEEEKDKEKERPPREGDKGSQRRESAKRIGSLAAFNEGYDLLGMQRDHGGERENLLKKGVRTALSLQRTIVKKAAALLEGRDGLQRLNRLYFAFIRQSQGRMGAADRGEELSEVEHPFGRPSVLLRLGQCILTAKRSMPRKLGGWVGPALLPLLLLAEKQDGRSFVVVGISPMNGAVLCSSDAERSEEEEKLHPLTNFKQVFRLAAKDLSITVRHSLFDANVVEVAAEDAQDFLGTIDFLLKKATPQHLRRSS